MKAILTLLIINSLILISCGNNSTIEEDLLSSPPSNERRGRPQDNYECQISSSGHCIFTGDPHKTILKPETDKILDREDQYLFSMEGAVALNSSGNILNASGRPAFDGDYLGYDPEYKERLSSDAKAFHRVMATMFSIRNALMYDIAAITQTEWDILINELAIREVKNSTYTDGPTPRDNYYGRQGIFDLAKNPQGRNIHHEVMKFLEESGIFLLCHVTSDDFGQMLKDTHPEGHDPCQVAEITSKVPF